MIEYDEGDWLLPSAFKLKGSVIPRAMLFAVPVSVLTVVLVFVDDYFSQFNVHQVSGMFEIAKSSSQMWAASTMGIAAMLGFRTSEAMKRFWEGTSLLHQMRGEWFESVSCLITFSRAAMKTRSDEVENFRHTLVRLMSLCHGSALEEIKDSSASSFECIDIKGLDRGTLLYLDESKKRYGFNRVEVLLHMIQILITQSLDDGVLVVAPPILSRVYQTLSRGLVNLLNATKIKNTRFPYPYAQCITVLLMVHMLWTPFMIASIIKTPWIAAIAAFIPIFAMFCLNCSAIQLEMPFGEDENDLPLALFQHEMNSGLLMLLHPKSDTLPHMSRSCEKDSEALITREMKMWYGDEYESMCQQQDKVSSMFSEAAEASSARSTTSPHRSFLARMTKLPEFSTSAGAIVGRRTSMETKPRLRSSTGESFPASMSSDTLNTYMSEDRLRNTMAGGVDAALRAALELDGSADRLSRISGAPIVLDAPPEAGVIPEGGMGSRAASYTSLDVVRPQAYHSSGEGRGFDLGRQPPIGGGSPGSSKDSLWAPLAPIAPPVVALPPVGELSDPHKALLMLSGQSAGHSMTAAGSLGRGALDAQWVSRLDDALRSLQCQTEEHVAALQANTQAVSGFAALFPEPAADGAAADKTRMAALMHLRRGPSTVSAGGATSAPPRNPNDLKI